MCNHTGCTSTKPVLLPALQFRVVLVKSIWNLRTCHHQPLQIWEVCVTNPNNKGKALLLMTLLNPLFSFTMKVTKVQTRTAFSWRLLGICSACFLKLGHMWLWMVGFKWEGTDALNSGRLITPSQNWGKTGKLLKQELACIQMHQHEETMFLGILSTLWVHPGNKKQKLTKPV